MNEIRRHAYKREHIASDGAAGTPRGSPRVTVCRNGQRSVHACLGRTFGHQENVSKVS